jgi:hypothetical protein
VPVGGDQPQPGQRAGRLGDLAAQRHIMGHIMGHITGRVMGHVMGHVMGRVWFPFPFRVRPWPVFRSLNHPRAPSQTANRMAKLYAVLLYAVCR